MSRTYARLDQSTLGPQLLLQQGGLVCTFDTDGASLNRNARSTQGVDSGQWYWEVIVGGTLTLAGNVSAGVVASGVATNQAVGGITDSFGYKAGDGTMQNAGSTLATVAVASAKDVIGFALDVDPATPTLAVYLNNLLLYTFSLPTGKTWHPAVSLGGATALQLSAYVNLGKREFDAAVPDGYRPGVYVDPVGISLRVSGGEDYLTQPTDSPPSTRYLGRILKPHTFAFKTGARPWTHGTRGRTSSFSDLDLDNSDGAFNALLADPPRGAQVVLRRLPVGGALATPDATLVALIDGVSAPSRNVVRVRLQSILAGYKVPLRRQTYTPFVAEGAANRPKPISLGACRNVPAVLVDGTTRRYDAHDAAMTQVAAVRDKGDRLDPLATPPDYTATADLRGVVLQTEPVGKLTIDLSSQGDSALTPPGTADTLEGYGDMATDTGGMPTRWVVRQVDDQTVLARVTDDGGRLEARTATDPTGHTIVFEVGYQDQSTSRDFVPIRKGVRYRLTFAIPAAHWPPVTRTSPLRLGAMMVAAPSQAGIDTSPLIAWSTSGTWAPGSYTAYFKADRDGTLVIFGQGLYDAAESGQPGWYGLDWWVHFDDVVLTAITAVPDDVLEGYGQMIGSLDRWVDDGTTGGSIVQEDIVTGSYTVGRMRLRALAGAGNIARVVYDDGSSPMSLTAGHHYRVALSSYGSSANAVLDVICKTSVSDVVVGTFTGTGAKEAIFTAPDDGQVVLQVHTADDLAGQYYVSYLRCLDVTAQDAEGVQSDDLQGITLEDYFQEILVKRHGAATSAYSATDLQDIDTATGYVFGVHIPDQINVDDALQLPLDSFGACLSDGGDGTLRVSRLRAPEDASDGEVEFAFTPTNLVGAPEPLDADAPGLTTNVGCRRNWSIFTDSDFVTDFDPSTGIDAATRERFKRLSQYLVASSVDLHPMYRDAQDAGQIDWLIDSPTDAQIEIDRIASIFTQSRRLYRLVGRSVGAPPALRFGSIVTCTHPAFGFEAGKKLLVFEATRYLFGDKVEVIALC